MSLWGSKDQANNAPNYGAELLSVGSGNAAKQTKTLALYANTTLNAYVTNQTDAIIYVTTDMITSKAVRVSGGPGWYLKRTGAGNRSGRVTYENIVSFGNKSTGPVYSTIDGRILAPNTTIQYPTLLNSYTKRAPWKVVGVDYAAGYPTATVLKDWNTISQANGSISLTAHRVRIDGNNCVLDSYDFTANGGADIVIFGSNTVITNSKFIWTDAVRLAGSFSSIGIIPGANNTTIKYCSFDGNAPAFGANAANQTSLIIGNGIGKLTLQYNYFFNFNQHVLEVGGSTPSSIDYQFNLIANGGSGATLQHMNYLQIASVGTYDVIAQFNTSYGPSTNPSGGEGFQLYNNGAGNVSAIFAYNTNVCTPDGSGLTHVSEFPSGGGGITRATIHDNYIAKGGGTTFFYSDPGGRDTYFQNFDMTTGNIVGPP
jgi:hypothetical protein